MQRSSMRPIATTPRGFTLVELSIVVLVLGILAAVAAPRMVGTAATARTNGTQRSLAVIRDALQMHRAETGAYPTAAAIQTSLQPRLSGPFPAAQVGSSPNANVASTTQNPITAAESAACGWVYNETTGEFRVNDTPSITW
ncbi:MAG TPA: type II secretion system protein [Planctomycetaceae bacterium]|nr:type II secretion system protein [Planctomycetaceae bacterium]